MRMNREPMPAGACLRDEHMDGRAESTIESWMSSYGDRVLQTIYVITGDREASEEIAQEVFIRAWRKLSQFRGESTPSTWLYRIAVNLAKNHLRRRTVIPLEPEAVEYAAGPAPGAGPEEHMLFRSTVEIVRASIAELPRELREVVALYYLDELSVGEVAAAVGKPVGTVKSRLARARAALRAVLESTGGSDEDR